MSFCRCLLFTDTVSGGEATVPRTLKKRTFACINITVRPAWPVNKELQNNTLMPLPTLDVMTLLVPLKGPIHFVFCVPDYDWTNQHPLRRKKAVVMGGI